MKDDDQEAFVAEEKGDDMEEVRKWYRSRRVHDRLSYENIQDYLPVPPQQFPHHHNHHRPHLERGAAQNVSFESASSMGGENELTVKRGNSNPPIRSTLSINEFLQPPSLEQPETSECHGMSEWDMQQQRHVRQSRSAQSFPSLLERRDSIASLTGSTPHPNSDYDFHPKNRNWRHFEHFNERDPRRNQQSSPLSLHTPTTSYISLRSSSSIPQRHPTDTTATASNTTTEDRMVRIEDTDEQPYEDNGVEEEDVEANANSISSSGSESSEEHFVWMKYSHRGRSPSPPPVLPSLPEKMNIWKVPSFLNLFTDPTEEASTTVQTEEKLAKPVPVPVVTEIVICSAPEY